jgi:hypothetical protein
MQRANSLNILRTVWCLRRLWGFCIWLSAFTRFAFIVKPRSSRSFWTVRLKVCLGRSVFPRGVHRRATLCSELEGMLRTCESHRIVLWPLLWLTSMCVYVAIRLYWYMAKTSWGFIEGIILKYFEFLFNGNRGLPARWYVEIMITLLLKMLILCGFWIL